MALIKLYEFDTLLSNFYGKWERFEETNPHTVRYYNSYFNGKDQQYIEQYVTLHYEMKEDENIYNRNVIFAFYNDCLNGKWSVAVPIFSLAELKEYINTNLDKVIEK